MSGKSIVVARLIIFIFSFAVTSMLWYGVFSSQNSYNQSGTRYDRTAEKSYSLDEVKSNSIVNPNSPYFIGFEELIDSGVSYDDYIYLQDVITNYVVNHEKLSFKKVSYQKDSFVGPVARGVYSDYSFEFVVEDIGNLRAEVSSSVVDEKITINILNNSKLLYSKELRIFQPKN